MQYEQNRFHVITISGENGGQLQFIVGPGNSQRVELIEDMDSHPFNVIDHEFSREGLRFLVDFLERALDMTEEER